MNKEYVKGVVVSILIIGGISALFLGTCYWLLVAPSENQAIYESNIVIYEDEEEIQYLMIVQPPNHADGLKYIHDHNGIVIKELYTDNRIHIEYMVEK